MCCGGFWQWVKTIFVPDSRHLAANNDDGDADQVGTTDFSFRIGPVPDSRARRAITNASSTLTDLTLDFGANQHRHDEITVRVLLRFISSSTPTCLRKLTLRQATRVAVLEQFLVAAAQSETIYHLTLECVCPLPVNTLVEFSHANRNVKILEMNEVFFGLTRTTFDQHDLQGRGTKIKLDKLILERLLFAPGVAVRIFANDFASCLEISNLRLGYIDCDFPGGDEVKRNIILGLLKSKVKHLDVGPHCTLGDFNTVLTAGKTTVESLVVHFDGGYRDAGEKFKLLASKMPEVEKLKFLNLTLSNHLPIQPEVKRAFFRAIDACVCLTDIQVIDHRFVLFDFFSPQEQQLLRDGRADRNNELGRFAANPSVYPARDLLKLMLQLNHCPTGRFQIARNLPAAYFGGKTSADEGTSHLTKS